jgi:heme A synthase
MPIIVTPGPAPTAEQLKAAKRLSALAESTLPRTRAVAEKWRNGLAALIGVVAASTVVKGRSSLDDLDSTAKAGVGILMLAAVVVGVLSLGLAMLASFGWPKATKVRTPDDLVTWEADEAKWSARELAGSMIGTALFIVLLVATLGVAWYSPGAAPKVKLTRTDGTVVCGKRIQVTDGVATVDSDVPIKVPASQIAGVTPVASCPK